MAFKVGDIVKHKASFLKSIGWYTGVPVNGEVVSSKHNDDTQLDSGYISVMWAGEWKGPTTILACNVMLAKDSDTSGM